MLPTRLSRCPVQTQIRHVFRASRENVYVQFKVPPASNVAGTENHWIAHADKVASSPSMARLIGNRQYQLFSTAWRLADIPDLYYYAGDPPIPIPGTVDLLTDAWHVPHFEYRWLRPLMPAIFVQVSTIFYVYCDRDVLTGSPNTSEWTAYRGAMSWHPLNITFSGRFIQLLHIQFLFGPIDRLTYERGFTPWIADDGGALESFDIDHPYPGYP